MFFMACSLQPTVAVDTNSWSGNAPLDQETRPAGATPPTLSCNCRPRGAGSVALYSALIGTIEHLVDVIVREYEMTLLR
jgi:hypothetical protein